jgi:WXG100 family type VII secretion target
MSKISIDTEHVRAAGRRLLSESSRMEQMSYELRRAIGSLDTWAWDGRSRSRAEPMLNRVQPESRRVTEELDNLGRTLMRIADTFELEDSNAARNLEGMSWVDWGAKAEDGSLIAGLLFGAGIFGLISAFSPSRVFAPTKRGDEIIGNPQLERYYQKQTGNTCGFQATQNILSAFGKYPTLTELKASAGYGPDKERTSYSDYREMFEANGVDVISHESFPSEQEAVESMVEDLRAGRAVLGRINVEPLDTYWNQEGGHAVWITGVRVNDEGEITHFICNDSGYGNDNYQNGSWNGTSMQSGEDGIPDGQGIEYPASEFLEAWEMREFSYIATEDPMPTPVGTPPPDTESSLNNYS